MKSELICPFCERVVEEFHPNSHVVPEWLFRISIEREGKFVGADFEVNRIGVVQGGSSGSFICWNCEGAFGEDDRYASLVFGKKTKSKEENIEDARQGQFKHEMGFAGCYVFERLNFKKLQRFVLGVVMRSHMSRAKEGKGLLGEKHFSEMKRIYKDVLSLDDKTYPIFIQIIDPGDNFRDLSCLPGLGRNPEGTRFVSFLAGGYFFKVVVQSHPIYGVEFDSRLKSDGKLLVPETRIDHSRSFRYAVKKSRLLARKRWPWGKKA